MSVSLGEKTQWCVCVCVCVCAHIRGVRVWGKCVVVPQHGHRVTLGKSFTPRTAGGGSVGRRVLLWSKYRFCYPLVCLGLYRPLCVFTLCVCVRVYVCVC